MSYMRFHQVRAQEGLCTDFFDRLDDGEGNNETCITTIPSKNYNESTAFLNGTVNFTTNSFPPFGKGFLFTVPGHGFYKDVVVNLTEIGGTAGVFS
mmetsp:Transcript_28455/g.27430  ORF Transcript_28455/g.27430 Transcript_28455/m.27430 type:complete len:96 (-) Transcript_28455:963-1250(-)